MVTLLIALIVITIGIEVLKTSRRIDADIEMLKAQLLLKETNARRSTEDVHQGPRP